MMNELYASLKDAGVAESALLKKIHTSIGAASEL
jgi:hypothetical protein